jgi:hypothetical protein
VKLNYIGSSGRRRRDGGRRLRDGAAVEDDERACNHAHKQNQATK